MFDNEYLGQKAMQHNSHELEAQAQYSRLSAAVKPQSNSTSYKHLVTLLVAVGFGIGVMVPIIQNNNHHKVQNANDNVPTQSGGGMDTPSDALPGLDLQA